MVLETILKVPETQHDTIKLPRVSSPEEVGIPSSAVTNFIEKVEKTGYRYHSLMILRHGKVAAEVHRYPFSPDTPHILYSISKSVTSCAVGFAVEEGFLSLDTKVCDVFPEECRKDTENEEKISSLTVEHLLTMTSGKAPSFLANKTKGSWVKQFVDAKWYAAPGEKFRYVNENCYMLCAMLQKRTGMSVIDFLTPRLFEPLGIKPPYWETDEWGVESGGWGLFLTPESFAKFILTYHQRGVFDGKQVVPRHWVESSTRTHAETGETGPVGSPGYGYCFWINTDNIYRAAGVFGQIGVSLQKEDLCLVATGGQVHYEEVLSMFYDFSECVTDEKLIPDEAETEKMKAYLSTRVVDKIPVSVAEANVQDTLNDKVIVLDKPLVANIAGMPPSVLNMASVYMTKNRAGNMNRFHFRFYDDYALFQWTEGDEICCMRLGLDGDYRASKITLAGTSYTVYGVAAWTAYDTLEVWIRPIESIGKRVLTFKFKGKRVTLSTYSEPPIDAMITDTVDSALNKIKNEKGRKLADKAYVFLRDFAQPVMHGTLVSKR